MFKQTMFDIFDEFKGDHSRLKALDPQERAVNGVVMDQTLKDKLSDVEEKLEKLEVHFEYLATTAEKSDKLKEANLTQKKQKKELARSLKEIEFTY